MSRRGYGFTKALRGGEAAERAAHENCVEAIRRLDAVTTMSGFREVIAWVATKWWFLRTTEDDKLMKAAWDRAAERCR